METITVNEPPESIVKDKITSVWIRIYYARKLQELVNIDNYQKARTDNQKAQAFGLIANLQPNERPRMAAIRALRIYFGFVNPTDYWLSAEKIYSDDCALFNAAIHDVAYSSVGYHSIGQIEDFIWVDAEGHFPDTF